MASPSEVLRREAIDIYEGVIDRAFISKRQLADWWVRQKCCDLVYNQFIHIMCEHKNKSYIANDVNLNLRQILQRGVFTEQTVQYMMTTAPPNGVFPTTYRFLNTHFPFFQDFNRIQPAFRQIVQECETATKNMAKVYISGNESIKAALAKARMDSDFSVLSIETALIASRQIDVKINSILVATRRNVEMLITTPSWVPAKNRQERRRHLQKNRVIEMDPKAAPATNVASIIAAYIVYEDDIRALLRSNKERDLCDVRQQQNAVLRQTDFFKGNTTEVSDYVWDARYTACSDALMARALQTSADKLALNPHVTKEERADAAREAKKAQAKAVRSIAKAQAIGDDAATALTQQ